MRCARSATTTCPMWFWVWNISASNRLSRPDTPQRGYSVSPHESQQTSGCSVAPYFHARKALLLCGSFLGSILAAVTGTWKAEVQCAIHKKTFKENNSPESNLSITHAWLFGAVLCEGGARENWQKPEIFVQQSFLYLKAWGLKNGPHYTLGNPTVAKNQKARFWFLQLLQVYEKTTATLFSNSPMSLALRKENVFPSYEQIRSKFFTPNHSVHKNQPKSIQIFCLAWWRFVIEKPSPEAFNLMEAAFGTLFGLPQN